MIASSDFAGFDTHHHNCALPLCVCFCTCLSNHLPHQGSHRSLPVSWGAIWRMWHMMLLYAVPFLCPMGLKCKGGTPWQHLCSVEPRSGLGPWDQTQDSQFVHAYWNFLMKLVGTDHCPHGADGSASYYRNTRKWKIQLWWWPSKPALKLMHHPRSKTMQKHCKNLCFWHRWSKNIVKVHNFATGPSKTLKKPVVFDTDGPKSL